MLIAPDRLWFDVQLEELSPRPKQYLSFGIKRNSQQLKDLQATTFEKKQTRAKQLMLEESELYAKSEFCPSKSDMALLNSLLVKGTVADKVQALILLMTESIVHNMSALDKLLKMCQKKNRREQMQVVEALKNWWIQYGLPNRKLQSFKEKPLLHKKATDKHILIWYVEDCLKKAYFQTLLVIECLLKDVVQFNRLQCQTFAYQLLSAKPEEERSLLNLLINKFGDVDSRVASKTTYLFKQLLSQHPRMKPIIVKEINRLIHRPNISLQARYLALTCLNQIVLSNKDNPSCVPDLMKTYLGIFEPLIESVDMTKKTESNVTEKDRPLEKIKKSSQKHEQSKSTKSTKTDSLNSIAPLLQAILTGLKRAWPYMEHLMNNLNQQNVDIKETTQKVMEQVSVLYRLCHVDNIGVACRAMMMCYEMDGKNEKNSMRCYRALYEMLLHPQLCYTPSIHHLFMDLLQRAMLEDSVVDRKAAFFKRLLQTATNAPPDFICSSLMIISRLLKDTKECWALFLASDNATLPKNAEQHSEEYDARKREPSFANAFHQSLWELSPFLYHFHPTIQLWTKNLLQHPNKIQDLSQMTQTDVIQYPGNPFEDFSSQRFIDKFVFKNPKTKHLKQNSNTDTLFASKNKQTEKDNYAVTTKDFAKLDGKAVKPEDMYIWSYSKEKARRCQWNLNQDEADNDNKGSDNSDSLNLAESDSDEDDIAFSSDGENTRSVIEEPQLSDLDSTIEGNELSLDEFANLSEEEGDNITEAIKLSAKKIFNEDPLDPALVDDEDEELSDMDLLYQSNSDDDMPNNTARTVIKNDRNKPKKSTNIVLSDKSSINEQDTEKRTLAKNNVFASVDQFAHLIDDEDQSSGEKDSNKSHINDKKREWVQSARKGDKRTNTDKKKHSRNKRPRMDKVPNVDRVKKRAFGNVQKKRVKV